MIGPKPLNGPKGPNFKGPKGPNFKGPQGPQGPKPLKGPRPPSGPRPPQGPRPLSANHPKPTQQGGGIRDAVRWAQEFIKRMPGSQPAKPNPLAAKPTGQLTHKNAGNLLGLASMTTTGAVTAPLGLGGSEDSSRKWRRLGYSSPEAYQKAVSQNAHKEQPLGSNNSSDTFNNTADINARIDQQKAERAAALKKTKGDYDHSSGGYTGQPLPEVFSRNTPAPNGGDGNGTQTSPGGKPIVMDMAAADALYKSRGLGSYSSGAKGYTSTDSSDPVYAKSKNYTELKPSNPLYAEAFGQDLADSQLKRNTSAMSMSDALADTESMRGPETDEGRLMRARAAFLDTDGSYEGLRAQERELDIIYAGGQHYALGDDGAFIKNSAGLNQAADPKQVQQLKSGQLYKDSFKQNLINSTADKASQAENPYVQAPAPVDFNTESSIDFGSTELLGNNMDMIAGNAFDKSDISPLNDGAFTQDLDVSQYIPGYKREPYMRQ